MDNSGLPITYRLFEGNNNDCETLMPVLDELKDDFGLKRVLLLIKNNVEICLQYLHKNGYIYSQTVRGANSDLILYYLVKDMLCLRMVQD